MNKHSLLTFLALAVGLMPGIPILRGQDAPNPVSIETLVERAVTQNPEIQFYQAEIESARAGRRVAGRLGNPELDFEIGHRSLREEGFQAEGVSYAVSLVQPIEWPGRMGLRKAQQIVSYCTKPKLPCAVSPLRLWANGWAPSTTD
ncbi:MAG: TolC family protein, partial [Verrucomicrobiota bacterium]